MTTTYFNGPGIDDHLRQTSATTGLSYFLTDHLGTTAALTDGSGNVVETLAYDSFGNNGGSTRTRYTYTGRERDPDTGLLYYRARFYDPQLGRFISEDPIGFAGGDANLYGYVWQNPLTARDPSGLDGDDWTPGGWADSIDQWLESLRTRLTGLNPDANKRNTVIHYAINTYKGINDLLRVGRGTGNYLFETPCTIPADELFGDIGRASNIALSLAGTAQGIAGNVRAVGGTRASAAAKMTPGLDELSHAASAADRGGLTAAGRSLTKHGAGARPGNTLFPAAKGNTATINQAAQNIVDDILTTPGSTIRNSNRGRFGPTIEVTAPDGRGVVFDANGKFLFFKE